MTSVEKLGRDRCDCVGKGHTGQTGAGIEQIEAEILCRVGEGHDCQAGATTEGIFSYAGDTVGNVDIR